MTNFDKTKITEMLTQVKSTPQSIVGCCDFFLKYGTSQAIRARLVQIWKAVFLKHLEDENETRMTSMVYVVNDIVLVF